MTPEEGVEEVEDLCIENTEVSTFLFTNIVPILSVSPYDNTFWIRIVWCVITFSSFVNFLSAGV